MVKLMQKRKKIKIKKKWDANRFGLPISKVITEQQKKELRSKKFKPKTSSTDSEELTVAQKLENRSKKFKLDESENNGKKRKISDVSATDEFERSIDRLQRFGAPMKGNEEVKKKRRTEKFDVKKAAGTDKTKKRLKKFSLEKTG